MSTHTKNLTLSVEAEVLATVRRVAAVSETTVNAMVREYLGRIAAKDSLAKTARARLRELSDTSPARLENKAWSREDLHAR